MQTLELKVPPLAVVLIIAVAMWFVSRYQLFAFAWPWRVPLAVLFLIAGVAIAFAGVMKFHQANTTVNPIKPETTSAIVTSSVYQFSRNPMYLGLLFALIAWAIWLSHALAFALPPLFVLYMNRFQIVPEERALAAKFGEEFTNYSRNVRRWL